MFDWVTQNLMNSRGVNRLDNIPASEKPEVKNDIPFILPSGVAGMRHIIFRVTLMTSSSRYAAGRAAKSSLLNKTIFHLIACAEHKLTIVLLTAQSPAVLVRNIIQRYCATEESQKSLLAIKPR